MLKDLYNLYDYLERNDDYNANLYLEREEQAYKDMLEFSKESADYGEDD